MERIIVFGKRKKGISREEFIERYENGHAVFGEKYYRGIITEFRRYYPISVAHIPKEGGKPEDAVSGEPPYDVITIYKLRDEKAVAEFEKIWADSAVRQAFLEDELTLFDRDATMSGFCEVREGKGIADPQPTSTEMSKVVRTSAREISD